MSKLSPLGQSMAALFTPEGERLRTSQKEGAQGGLAKPSANRIPGSANQISSHKSQDSLGNPNSPGYESWGKKKEQQESPGGTTQEKAPSPNADLIHPPNQDAQSIRLATGWEKILLAQKKLCEKAKGLFTLLEGPVRYAGNRRNRLLRNKTRGFIVDVDIQEVADKEAIEAKAKAEEAKKKAA